MFQPSNVLILAAPFVQPPPPQPWVANSRSQIHLQELQAHCLFLKVRTVLNDVGLDWVFNFKVTEDQPLMGLTSVRQMAASSDLPPGAYRYLHQTFIARSGEPKNRSWPGTAFSNRIEFIDASSEGLFFCQPGSASRWDPVNLVFSPVNTVDWSRFPLNFR